MKIELDKIKSFGRAAVLIVLIASCSTYKKEVENVEKQSTPNIVIIFTDDMGYGDLSCYGHPVIQTPNIDQMAAEGIKLTSFYAAAPVCTPSRAALLTGRYPIRNLPNNLGPESTHGLPESEVTIANILKEQNYKTMAIGKWHLGYGKPELMPTGRGFDSFYGLPYSNDMILPWCPWLEPEHILELYRDNEPIREIGFEQDSLTIDYTREAVDFIKKSKGEPFFLYFAHSMPHLPISTAKSFRGKSKAGLYGDVIQTIDWSVGEIMNAIKESGLDDNTMVIFASDNGPWQNVPDRMLQRGVEPWHGGSAGLLRGSKATSYEGGFRVPGIVRWPGQVPSGLVSNEMATTMDLFSTIVKIAGGNLPSDREIDGGNILPLLKGEGTTSRDQFFYLKGKRVEAVRDGLWKFRYTKTAGIELFNLNVDPSEKYNRAQENVGLVKKYYQQMKGFALETGAQIDEIELPIQDI
jgi:arylsulfatase A